MQQPVAPLLDLGLRSNDISQNIMSPEYTWAGKVLGLVLARTDKENKGLPESQRGYRAKTFNEVLVSPSSLLGPRRSPHPY